MCAIFCVVKIFDGWGRQVPLTDRMVGHGQIAPRIRRYEHRRKVTFTPSASARVDPCTFSVYDLLHAICLLTPFLLNCLNETKRVVNIRSTQRVQTSSKPPLLHC